MWLFGFHVVPPQERMRHVGSLRLGKHEVRWVGRHGIPDRRQRWVELGQQAKLTIPQAFTNPIPGSFRQRHFWLGFQQYNKLFEPFLDIFTYYREEQIQGLLKPRIHPQGIGRLQCLLGRLKSLLLLHLCRMLFKSSDHLFDSLLMLLQSLLSFLLLESRVSERMLLRTERFILAACSFNLLLYGVLLLSAAFAFGSGAAAWFDLCEPPAFGIFRQAIKIKRHNSSLVVSSDGLRGHVSGVGPRVSTRVNASVVLQKLGELSPPKMSGRSIARAAGSGATMLR